MCFLCGVTYIIINVCIISVPPLQCYGPRLGLHVMWKHKSDDAGLWDGLVRGQCTSRNDQVYAAGGNATLSNSGSWGGIDLSSSSSSSSYSVGPGLRAHDQPILHYATFTAMCYANVAALLLGASYYCHCAMPWCASRARPAPCEFARRVRCRVTVTPVHRWKRQRPSSSRMYCLKTSPATMVCAQVLSGAMTRARTG